MAKKVMPRIRLNAWQAGQSLPCYIEVKRRAALALTPCLAELGLKLSDYLPPIGGSKKPRSHGLFCFFVVNLFFA